MSKHIVITNEEIKNAKQRNSHRCMIADAIRKAIPQARFIDVDLQTIKYTDKITGMRKVFLTPKIAQVALVRFDQGKALAPFRLKLGKVVLERVSGWINTRRKNPTLSREEKRTSKKIIRTSAPYERKFGLRAFQP